MMHENMLYLPRIAQPRKWKPRLLCFYPVSYPGIKIFSSCYSWIIFPSSLTLPCILHTPPLPVHVLSLLCLPFPAWRRGPVGGEHEWGVFGGGGEIVAGERPECDPRRLLETQRLFTSLEGTHNWHITIFNETTLIFSTRVKVNVFTGGSWCMNNNGFYVSHKNRFPVNIQHVQFKNGKYHLW